MNSGLVPHEPARKVHRPGNGEERQQRQGRGQKCGEEVLGAVAEGGEQCIASQLCRDRLRQPVTEVEGLERDECGHQHRRGERGPHDLADRQRVVLQSLVRHRDAAYSENHEHSEEHRRDHEYRLRPREEESAHTDPHHGRRFPGTRSFEVAREIVQKRGRGQGRHRAFESPRRPVHERRCRRDDHRRAHGVPSPRVQPRELVRVDDCNHPEEHRHWRANRRNGEPRHE